MFFEPNLIQKKKTFDTCWSEFIILFNENDCVEIVTESNICLC